MMNPDYDTNINKVRSYPDYPPIPCIDCITLPICRAYLLTKEIPNNYFCGRVRREGVLELYRKCSTVADYICRYSSGDDKSLTYNVKAVYLFENTFLLQKTITYILEGKET